MEVTIELVGRGGRHFDLQHVSGERISIGRGFDNDIVLADPHVCAHHAVLETNEKGEILLKDLGSVNGTFTARHKRIDSPCVVDSGDEFELGKTRVRIYRRNHEVAPSIRLNWVENIANMANRPLVAGIVLILAAIMSLYTQYAAEIGEFHIGRELLITIGVLILIALWPVGWTLYARYKKHDARFLAQFSATIVFVILASGIQKLQQWLAYHHGSSVVSDSVGMFVYIILAILLLWFNFYLSIFQTAKRRWLYSIVITVLLGSAVYVTTTIDNDSFTSRPEYTANLFPPSVSFYTTQSVDEYLKDADVIFDKALENIAEEK